MQTTTGKRTALSLLFSLAIGLAFGAASPAHAQAFPNKPITLVVPYTPGGTTDNIVRAIQAKFGEQLGQPIVIDNRPGASGNVGNRSVARAAPEGYTVGIMPTTVGTFPLMGQNLGYDPLATSATSAPSPKRRASCSFARIRRCAPSPTS